MMLLLHELVMMYELSLRYKTPHCHVSPQRKLSRKFGVHGVPRLVLLDGETGRVITRDGFERLTQDTTGVGFPWRRKPIHDVIKGTLLQPGQDTAKEITAKSALEGKSVIGFYFSAHWVIHHAFSFLSFFLCVCV